MLFVFFLLDKLAFFATPKALNLNGWIGLFYSMIPWVLAGMIPLWVLGRHARFVYWVLAPIAILLECAEWFTRINFCTTLTGSWLGILLASSPAEMKWFLGQYLSFTMVACFLGIVVLIVFASWCISLAKSSKVTRMTLGAAAFSTLLFVYGNRIPYNDFYETTRTFPAIYLVSSTMLNCKTQVNLARMKSYPQLPASIRATPSTNETVTGVFVLGESATRGHWGLYGYPRNTTPEMTALGAELVVFTDLVTTDCSTCEAMRSLFTTRTIEKQSDVRYSMPQALRTCDFDVALFSNQWRWDFWRWNGLDCDETYSFAGCDPFLCMNECGETNGYDSVLLKYLDEGLATMQGNRIVFLHLFGSHEDCRDRYPWENLPFGAETNKPVVMASRKGNIDDYDNSIWYTDKILGEVVRRVRALRQPAWVIYVPDHGETPSSKNWRLATDPDLWNIPFVVWTSPEFNAQYSERVAALRRAKDKPLQSDQLLYGLLRFMGVEGLGVPPSEDFLDDSFLPRRPRRVQGGTAVYPGESR